jgi:hypothetical protein
VTVRLRITLAGSMTEYLFDRGTISVGRAPSNDLVLRGVQAAVRHGALHQGADGSLTFEALACGQPALLLRDGAIVGESDGDAPARWELAAGDFLSLGLDATRLEIVSVSAPEQAPWRFEPAPSPAEATAEALALTLSMCEDVGSHDDPLRAALDLLPALARASGAASLVRADVSLFTESDEFFDLTYSATYSNGAASPSQGRDPLHVFAGPQSVSLQSQLEEDASLVACSLDSSHALTLLRGADAPQGALALELSEPCAHARDLLALAAALFTSAARAARARRARRDLSEENRYFRERERRHYLFKELVCESSPMKRTYERLNELVSSDDPALILGEAGSGKELLARALHHLGPRREGVFISLKCGAVPDEVLGVELFGCVASELVGAVAPRKGAFELATDGTVYLEEVERLSPPLQGKLSRAIKEGEVRRVGDSVGRRVRARIVASTHIPLDQLARSGALRHDLLLVLRDHTLTVPALRARREDLMPLARMFLNSYATRYGARARAFAPDVAQRMLEYDWPGNVRELQSFVETAVLRAPRDAERIEARDLTF